MWSKIYLKEEIVPTNLTSMWNSWIVQYKEEPKTVFTVRTLIVPHFVVTDSAERSRSVCAQCQEKAHFSSFQFISAVFHENCGIKLQ